MINSMLASLVRFLLWLRYDIRVSGLPGVAARGRRGVVFLPNHPALIDPIILLAVLHKFAPRALADRDQIDRFFIRWLARRVNVRPIPDLAKHGASSRHQIEAMLADSIAGLRLGENVLLYPSGQVYRRHVEDLGANSAAHLIVQRVPEARVVLVRTRGLWGSAFSWADGREPNVAQVVRKAVRSLVASAIFFCPRRRVTVELVEPDDLPRSADRATLNQYLERFYNQDAPPRTYVPCTPWERGGVRTKPEPAPPPAAERAADVPAATRELVIERLREMTGRSEIRDADRLAHELGMDSLSRAELTAWLAGEFGFPQAGPDALQTVADVLRAAVGEAVGAAPVQIAAPRAHWFAHEGDARRLAIPPGDTIAEVFLEQARRDRGRAILADSLAGTLTYRDVLTRTLLLAPLLEAMEGEHLGILLPAGAAAGVAYLAAVFAGKTPVMVNWTAGPRNVSHAMEMLDVRRVVTARAMADRLRESGVDLAPLADRMAFLEDLAGGLSPRAKLTAASAARLCRRTRLDRRRVSPVAAVLFTSGSETLPKAVPLTHANILANLRDVTERIAVLAGDCLLGMLPPFHSFGLSVTTIMPLCLGLRTCYWPNPTDGAALAAMVEACRATLTIGTPTFLAGMVRAARTEQLRTLRLAVTGAERCPPRLYDALAGACPGLKVLEGYGVTECSPIISVNDEAAPRRETIGRVLPSLRYAIVDEDAVRPAPVGQPGMLLVRGRSVFGGYIGREAPSPFVEWQGEPWYRTGDLVRQDAGGVLTFVGRLKRFAKLGGEMISLPAIEAVLEEQFAPPPEAAGAKDRGPAVAVEALGDEAHVEIVLATPLDVTRERANECLRAAGLSPLHNIRRVVRVESIPVLGTGKTDYRALREKLVKSVNA